MWLDSWHSPMELYQLMLAYFKYMYQKKEIFKVTVICLFKKRLAFYI